MKRPTRAAKSPAPANHSRTGPSLTNRKGTEAVSHNNKHSAAEDNLRQAADVIGNPWTVARLIASSVEAKPEGRQLTAPQGAVKLAVREAARVMGRSDNTIRAYLNAWNAAAADGHCYPSKRLTPEDGWNAGMPAAGLWEQYRNPNSHSRKAEVETIPADPVEASHAAASRMTVEQKQSAARSLMADPAVSQGVIRDSVRTDPAAAAAADQALEDRARNTPPVRDRQEPTANTDKQYALQAVTQARKVRRAVSDLVSMVNDLGDRSIAEAIIDDADWSITALTAIKASLHGEQSMDEQLAALLNEEV